MDSASEEFQMENVALIPAEESSSGNKSSWVIELEEEISKEEVESGGRSLPEVFSVSFTASKQQYYIPTLISIGPYHFGRAELTSMELHKTKAVRKMQKRIHGRSMQSIVAKEIVAMDKTIRDFYDKELSYSAIDLAWMVTKDSCFLFEFMLKYLRTIEGKHDFHNDCVVEGRYDSILSSSPMNPLWSKILYDLVLFQNQIPLCVLPRLLAIAEFKSDPEDIVSDILTAVAELSGTQIFYRSMPQSFKKHESVHLLEVLYYCHVGRDLQCYRREASSSATDHPLLHFGWIQSFLTSCCSGWRRGRGVEDHERPLLEKLPTAAELRKKGVHFRAVQSTKNSMAETHGGVIAGVRFEDETSTLYLPEMKIDHFRLALLQNFVALEYNYEKYRPAPITSFFLFMDELVDDEEDVAVLRHANIIQNPQVSNNLVAQGVDGLITYYHVPTGCKPIDDARAGIRRYSRRKYKILWNEFISTYFAKPWLVASAVAATLLVLMTVLQVFCLFYTCNPSTGFNIL